MVLVQSTCGHRATVDVMVIAVAAMATQTASTRCLLAVLRKMVACLGTRSRVPLRLQLPTAAEVAPNDR